MLELGLGRGKKEKYHFCRCRFHLYREVYPSSDIPKAVLPSPFEKIYRVIDQMSVTRAIYDPPTTV